MESSFLSTSICIKYFVVDSPNTKNYGLNHVNRVKVGERVRYYKYTFQNGIKYALYDFRNREYALINEIRFNEYFMSESDYRDKQIDIILWDNQN